MEQLEKFFEEIFIQKAPWQLPTKAKEVIVKIAPWVTLIILIFSLPALFSFFGFGSVFMTWGARFGFSYGVRYYFGLIVLLIEVILMAMSISPLLKKQIKGWKLIYYINLISFVYSLITAYTVGSVIWAIINIIIGLYIIFQVKSYYK